MYECVCAAAGMYVVKMCLCKRETAEKGLPEVTPVVADKLPPAIQGFAKMPILLSQLLLITSEEKNIGMLDKEGWCRWHADRHFMNVKPLMKEYIYSYK